MLGYLANVRVGAATYNLAHTEVLPLLVGAAAAFEAGADLYCSA